MQIINKLLRLQKVYIFFISFVLFIIFFSTAFLHANNFRVSNIEISSPFELNFRKSRVIDQGFETSFSNLLTMITTSGDKEKIKDIKLKELKAMIDSFTISDEKFINNVYFAKLETTFNKKKILNYLERNNIFPSIPIKKKILLVPILIDAETDKIYLFSDNIFYKKWNENKENYHLLNYLLPAEDLEDLKTIQQNFKSIENHDFLNLIEKYDLKDYIISIIFKNKNEIRVLSKINFKDSLKLNNQKFENIDLNNEKNFQKILISLKNIYEDYWKNNNEINTSIKLPLTVSVESKDYKKIQKLERVLGKIDLVSNFYILRFNNKNIFYKIIYNGSPKNFLNDLSKNNINLKTKKNIWIIE